MSQRDQNFQNIAWFKDLSTRGLLNLDPPYQRRSTWTPRFREDFIDTILLKYPSPAIFLFESINENDEAKYAVVDGKQRLLTVLDFANNRFAIGDRSPLTNLRGLYYENMTVDQRKDFLRYRFSVEYLPSENEAEINNIFDRLNRNVKKLTAQELRHARFDGLFITAAEQLSEWLETQFGTTFPRIADLSRRQMKDVEIVASLLLYLEDGAKGYSTATLDDAYAERDETWEGETVIKNRFQNVIRYLVSVTESTDGEFILQSRFRNQADFYSLFAAVADLQASCGVPHPDIVATRLKAFIELLDSGAAPRQAAEYLEAARSASNDLGPRKARIAVMKKVLLGQELGGNGPG